MNRTQLTWPVNVTVAEGRVGDGAGLAVERDVDLDRVGELAAATVTVTLRIFGVDEAWVERAADGEGVADAPEVAGAPTDEMRAEVVGPVATDTEPLM